MHPSDKLQKVIGGKRYNVGTATLLASDEYWDGSNWERNGRNQFLYKTPNGAYFEVNLTQWQGEINTLLPLSKNEAKELYSELQEHEVEWEDAFDESVEEAGPGRPTFFGEPMKGKTINFTEAMISWLDAQPGGAGETVRRLVAEAMK